MDLSVSSSSEEMKVTIGKGGFCPVKGTEGASGFDLSAPRTVRISPGAVYCIDMEVSIQLPKGYTGFIKARSSYAVKGLVVLGGVIDSDFRGPIQVLVTAVGDDSILLLAGRRFVQIVPIKTGNLDMHVVAELTATTRGAGMMGSTDDNANKTDGMVQESQLIEVDDDDEDEDDGDDDKGSKE